MKTVADGGFVIDSRLAQDLVDGHHLGDPEQVSRRVMAALLYLRERPA